VATKTYGTVSPEQQKAMSGLEFVKGLASGALPLNTIAQTLGYDVVEAENVALSSRSIQRALTLIHGARCTAASRRLFSIAAGAWPSNRRSKGVASTTLEFNFARPSHHGRDGPDQSRGQSPQLRPSCRHGRRPRH
jgi:hypothetical protein